MNTLFAAARAAVFGLAFFVVTPGLVVADDMKAKAVVAGDLAIEAAWTRATPPGANAGGGYVTITNNGSHADRIIGGSSDRAGIVEIHSMEMVGDVMKMRPVAGGLEIPAGETITLKPGGFHVMFMGLESPFVEGESIIVDLTFEQAGDVTLTFPVAAIGADAHSGHSKHGKSHSH